MRRPRSLKQSLKKSNKYGYRKRFVYLIRRLTEPEIGSPTRARAFWDLRSVCRIQRWMREADPEGKQRICRREGVSEPDLETLVALARDRFARACGRDTEAVSENIESRLNEKDSLDRRRVALRRLLSEAASAKVGHG